MNYLHLRRSLTAAAFLTLSTGTAVAGGFDRGGVNIGLLFDPGRYAAETGVTIVMPDRTIQNVRRGISLSPFPPQSTTSIGVDLDYTVPRAGVKVGVTDDIDCLATYSEPYGADAGYGMNNAYSPTAVEFSIDTKDYGLTCSYKFKTESGQFRIIGGLSYLEIDAFQSRQTFGDFAPLGTSVTISPLIPAINPQGLGLFRLSDETFGWRAGVAYEIPEIALRASLVYNSKYDLNGLSGTVDTTRLGGLGTVTRVNSSTEIPQSVEFRLQTGIAEGTLAFGSIKWQDWSRLGIIPINGVTSPVTGLPSPVSFDPLYQDGWTFAAGLGRAFTEQISGLLSVGYDRGTKTVAGTQTHTWSLSGGLSFKATENVEIAVGGLIGILNDGASSPTGGDAANNIFYTFDDDIVTAVNVSAKVRF